MNKVIINNQPSVEGVPTVILAGSYKVYCQNCKWCYYSRLWKRFFCTLFFTKEFAKLPYTTSYFRNTKIDEINLKNDCTDYKRKWWKFWVK